MKRMTRLIIGAIVCVLLVICSLAGNKVINMDLESVPTEGTAKDEVKVPGITHMPTETLESQAPEAMEPPSEETADISQQETTGPSVTETSPAATEGTIPTTEPEEVGPTLHENETDRVPNK